jgi:arabinose operon protein AraL
VSRARPDRLYDAYVLDLDGTIYLGDELLPGARRLVETLRERGAAVRFVSNNPTREPEQYAEKLARLGVPTPVEHIVNTTVTMTRWLLEHHPGAVVFPIAEEPLKRALAAAGIRMSEDPAEIDIVIASFDRGLRYDKLQIAFDAIRVHRRAYLVATNPDPFCPLPGGGGEPDAAAVTAAIEASTGTTCRAIVGKPDPAILAVALDGLEVAPEDCLVVGDRLGTDIGLGRAAGMPTALVLTGDTQEDDLRGLAADRAPTFVVDRIDALLP